MRGIFRFQLLLVCLACFQSCGQFESVNNDVMYPYASKPDFFYDLKLVSVDRDQDNRERYVFDLALSFAENAGQEVSYQVAFSNSNRSGVCQTETLTAVAETKHHRLQCITPTPGDIHLQLKIVGPTGESEVSQFKF